MVVRVLLTSEASLAVAFATTIAVLEEEGKILHLLFCFGMGL